MNDADTVEKHITQFRVNRSKLASLGTTVTEEHAAVILLASLPSTWSAFITSQQGRPNLTVSMVIAAIYQHENTKRITGNQSAQDGDGALFAKNRFQKPRKPWLQSRDQSGQSGQNFNKRGFKCSYCKKPGHYWKECRKKKFDDQKRGITSISNKATQNLQSSSTGCFIINAVL